MILCLSTPGTTLPSGPAAPVVARPEAPPYVAQTTSLLGTTAFLCGFVAVCAGDSSSACFLVFSRCISSKLRTPKTLESHFSVFRTCWSLYGVTSSAARVFRRLRTTISRDSRKASLPDSFVG